MLKLIYDNDFDRASISSFPNSKTDLENLKNVYREKIAKFDSKTVIISGSLNEYREINSLAIVRHNITPDGLVRLKLYDGSNLIYDSTIQVDVPNTLESRLFGTLELGTSPFYYASCNNFYFAFDMKAYNRFEIILDDSRRKDNILLLSRIFMGKSISFGVDYNFNLTYVDSSPQIRTKSGSLISGKEAIYRKLTLTFPYLKRELRNELNQLLINNGKRKEVFLKLFDTDNTDLRRDYSALFKITNDVGVSYPYFEEWSSQLEFSEC